MQTLKNISQTFKFWLLHELAHAMTPELSGEAAEDFADRFAATVLFPIVLAEEAYTKITHIRNSGTAVNEILAIASTYTISPYTVLGEMNNYAKATSQPEISIDIGGAIANYNKQIGRVSENIFEEQNPEAGKYIEVCEKEFGSNFFQALSRYIIENKKEAGIIQRLMNIPFADAKGIYTELIHEKNPT
jgi:hypothetical protein